MTYKHIKRGLDVVLSLIGLLILAIPMLLIAVAVKLDSKGPVIFRQKRLGLHGKTFEMYKFRTMYVGAEAQGVYSDKGDPRQTRVGRILRICSGDELPQLLNVLKGDMSLIGPRPPLTYHPWPLEDYTPEQRKMFEVRPGITGWAQVHGRKDVEWHKRIEMNVYYAENVTFMMDVKILFTTVLKVLTNADNENKGATVAEPAASAKETILK